jgi:hypothetical protein
MFIERRFMPLNDEDLTRRAFAAYFRSGGVAQPARADSGLVKHKGKYYVVLKSTAGVLAVYRVRNFDGALRRMKRPPKALIDE